mmetsp:Transcript_34491/g.102481  ORF Transcript_34491/g.102481 Transcript_34491/m.102481 type:complete len:429 (-) Transcript_34491:148-1434(-)
MERGGLDAVALARHPQFGRRAGNRILGAQGAAGVLRASLLVLDLPVPAHDKLPDTIQEQEQRHPCRSYRQPNPGHQVRLHDHFAELHAERVHLVAEGGSAAGEEEEPAEDGHGEQAPGRLRLADSAPAVRERRDQTSQAEDHQPREVPDDVPGRVDLRDVVHDLELQVIVGLVDDPVGMRHLQRHVAHGPQVHAEAHRHDDDEHVRADRKDLVPGPDRRSGPVGLLVASAPGQVRVLVVVDLVAQVDGHDHRVVPVPLREEDEARDPVLLGVLRHVPQALVLAVVAAPPRLGVVVVHDDHQPLVSHCLDGTVEDLQESLAFQVRIRSDVLIFDRRVQRVPLGAIHHPHAVEAQLHDAVHDLVHLPDLQTAHSVRRGVGAVPADAGPLHSLPFLVDDVAAAGPQGCLLGVEQRRTVKWSLWLADIGGEG